jgi:ribosomal 50S subunit-associated protein YjgA (DUF615 family)
MNEPTGPNVGAKPIESDDALREHLHTSRANALDAVRFHSRELVRHLRIAQGSERGIDALNTRPDGDRLAMVLDEAMAEQDAAQPAMAWRADDVPPAYDRETATSAQLGR